MWQPIFEALNRGGPVLWLIAALSVVTLALILWKIWQLSRLGAWSERAALAALQAWETGHVHAAQQHVADQPVMRARLVSHAIATRCDGSFADAEAREEVARFARADLVQARIGLRALELVSTIAPLLGLLGTVLGMIAAFRTLQEAGSNANPSDLAGGIWEALLTTAAGMAIAIPAGVALSWFEGVVDRLQSDMEDAATRIFTRGIARHEVTLHSGAA